MPKKGRPQNQNNKKEFLEAATAFYDSKRINEQKKYIEALRKKYNIPFTTCFKTWNNLWQYLYKDYFQNATSNIDITDQPYAELHDFLQEILQKLQIEIRDNSNSIITDTSHLDDKKVLSAAFLSAFFDIYRTAEHTKQAKEYAIYDKSII